MGAKGESTTRATTSLSSLVSELLAPLPLKTPTPYQSRPSKTFGLQSRPRCRTWDDSSRIGDHGPLDGIDIGKGGQIFPGEGGLVLADPHLRIREITGIEVGILEELAIAGGGAFKRYLSLPIFSIVSLEVQPGPVEVELVILGGIVLVELQEGPDVLHY